MNKKWLIIAAFAAAATAVIPLCADDGSYLDIVTGYRRDCYTTEINTFNGKNALVSKNTLKADDLSLYQLGGKGELAFCNFYVIGEGYYGWSDNGKYREVSKILKRVSIKTTANLRKGRTKDYSFGGGFYFPTCGLFTVGPALGYSYHHQHFRVHDARFNEAPDVCLNGLDTTTRWKGPWAGVDGRMNLCGYKVRAGYAYNWAKWHAKWQLEDTSNDWVNFSEICKSSHAHGQTAYVDVIWSLVPFVELGLGVKWQHWEAKNGKQKFLKKGVSDSYDCECEYDLETETHSEQLNHDRVKHTLWQSVAISLDLGFAF